MRYFFLFLAVIFLYASPICAQPLGTWQEHLPFGMAIDLAGGPGKIYAATPFSCFSISVSDP